MTLYRSAKKLPRSVKELLMGLALSTTVLWNGLRGGARSSAVRDATIALWYEVVIYNGSRKAYQQLRRLRGRQGLKLHLGCGADIRTGWINVDGFTILPPVPTDAPGTYVVQYDLRQPLPLEDGSVSLIYSSHFWEHLTAADGHRLFQESYRVLAVGGRFRIALPDLETMFQAYLANNEDYFSELRQSDLFIPSRPEHKTLSLSDCLNFSIYQSGEHKCIYNAERLSQQLREIGFSSAEPVAFDPAVDVNTSIRKAYSFYVEAVK